MCRPSPATRGARPALSPLPRSPQLFPWPLRGRSRPPRPFPPHPGPRYPLVRLSASCSLPEKWTPKPCRIDRSERTATAHAPRAPRRAPCYRSAHSGQPRLAILRTGAFEESVHFLRLYPLRGSPDAEGLLSHRANAASRRARRAPERPGVCGAVGSATSGALRNKCACAPWAPARNATRREPMKRQRLSSPGQSAFGAESLTPI